MVCAYVIYSLTIVLVSNSYRKVPHSHANTNMNMLCIHICVCTWGWGWWQGGTGEVRWTGEASVHVTVCGYVTYIMLWQTLLMGAGMGLWVMGRWPVPVPTNTRTCDPCGLLRPVTLPRYPTFTWCEACATCASFPIRIAQLVKIPR